MEGRGVEVEKVGGMGGEIGEVEVEEMIGDLLVEGMIEEVVEEEGREVAPGAEAVTGKGEVQAIGA